jgi:hypothetical protein
MTEDPGRPSRREYNATTTKLKLEDLECDEDKTGQWSRMMIGWLSPTKVVDSK